MMHIQPIASALSKSFTNAYFPPKDFDNSHNNESHLCSSSSQLTVNVQDPFELLIPKSNINHQFNSIINLLNPSSLISTYSNGILITNSNSFHDSCIFSYDYDNLQLNKIIKIPLITSQIICMETINDKVLILSNAKVLHIIDPLSGSILDSKKLSFQFTSIKQVISLPTNSNITLFLHTNGSFCQLIDLDVDFSISLKTSLIYLDFWPISILSLDSSLFYIFSSLGSYQILLFNSSDCSLSSTSSDKKLNLLDRKYGKLIDIKYFNNDNNTFIFIQEKGWITYQFITFSKKSINKSLNNLSLMISSPLSSNFDKIIQFNKKSLILMNDRSLILLSNNNIHPIESNLNDELLDMWMDFKNNRILGLFNINGLNKQINYLNTDTLSWDSFNSINKELSCSNIIYQDETFEIINNKFNRLILKNTNNNCELCTLFNFNINHIKIIDLNPVINLFDSFQYFLILDSVGNCQLFVFNNDTSKIVRIFNPLPKIKTVSYYDGDKILLFKDEDNKTVFINILNFEISSKVKLNSKSNFQIYNLTDQLNQFDTDYFFNIDIVSFDELIQYNVTLKENTWVGIRTNQQSLFFKFSLDLLAQSPELFLTYSILNKNIDSNIISEITKLDNQLLLNYINKIANFCLSNNTLMIEYSINILHTLMLHDLQIINLLLENCLKDDVSLVNTILLTFYISISHKQLIYPTDKILHNIITYMLDLNFKICEICIDVLKKIEIKDYRINDNADSTNPDDFDLIIFFNELFKIRSLFFNDSKKRNFKSFEKCTEFFNHVMENEIFDGFVIMCTIIENPLFELEDKRHVIDYINYFLIEKNEVLENNENCVLILFILINSIFSLLSIMSNHELHSSDEFWETLYLLLNLLSTKFKEFFAINCNENNWKDVLLNKKELSVCLILNEHGYYGVMYIKKVNNEWSLIPLKSSKSQLTNLDKGNQCIDNVDIKKIKDRLASGGVQNLMIKCPVVFQKLDVVAILNMNKLSIEVWRSNNDHNDELLRDNITIQILKDNLIPLKVPDFNLILLQLIWAKLNYTSTESPTINGSIFTTLVHEFQRQISIPPTSPKSGKITPNAGLWFSDQSYLDTEGAFVAEPYGEFSFAILLQEYLNVFPQLNNSSVSIREESGQLALVLEGKPVFVWMLT